MLNTKKLMSGGLSNLRIIFIVLCLLPSIAHAGISVTTANSSPNASVSYNFHLQPGEKKSDSVIITNIGQENITVNLYGADAISTGQNSFAAKDSSNDQYTIGKWITFDKNSITLKPQEKQTVPFTIEIPQKTTPGIFAGAIAASIVNQQIAQETPIGVITHSRTIIPVYVNIPGQEIYSYDWQDFSYLQTAQPHFHVTVKNTGNTVIAIDGSIIISNAGSPDQILQTIPVETTNIYQGDSSTINAYFNQSLASGITNNLTTEAKINISKIDVITNSKTDTKELTKSINFQINRFYLIYLPLLVLLGIIGVIVILFIHNKTIKKNAVRYKVAANDTLDSISKKQNVNWKKIVQINKLKPPYALKLGTEILIPQNHKNK